MGRKRKNQIFTSKLGSKSAITQGKKLKKLPLEEKDYGCGRPSHTFFSDSSNKSLALKDLDQIVAKVAGCFEQKQVVIEEYLRFYFPELFLNLEFGRKFEKNVADLFDQYSQEMKKINIASKTASILTTGLPNSTASLTGYSPKRLQQLRNGKEEEEDKEKERVDVEKENWLKQWLFDHAPVCSGRLSERMVPWGTYEEIWKQYAEEAQNNEQSFYRSVESIRTKMKEWKIKRAKFDRYRCEYCFEGNEALLRRSSGKEQEGDEEAIKDLLEHHKLVKERSESYKKDIEDCKGNEVVVVWDYSTIHETSVFKVKLLDFAICYNGSWSYMDYLSPSKHTWHFSKTALERLLIDNPWMKQLDQISFWSDGALRTKDNLNTFNQISAEFKIPFKVNFFAPHHGHSVCDGHFGVCKQKLRRTLGTKLVEDAKQIAEIFQDIQNTTIIYIPEIDPTLPSPVKALKKGIQSFYEFQLSGNNSIKCRKTRKCEWEEQRLEHVQEQKVAAKPHKFKTDPWVVRKKKREEEISCLNCNKHWKSSVNWIRCAKCGKFILCDKCKGKKSILDGHQADCTGKEMES